MLLRLFMPLSCHACLPIVRPDALAVRLPSTLGFIGMLGCIMVFCHRRMPARYAFLAALFAATACGFYATEGRAFGLVMGCAAGALLGWQRAADRSPRLLALTLLGVFLMAMTALNYYSIFFLFPLGLAEIVRWRQRGRLDFAVLAATGVGTSRACPSFAVYPRQPTICRTLLVYRILGSNSRVLPKVRAHSDPRCSACFAAAWFCWFIP